MKKILVPVVASGLFLLVLSSVMAQDNPVSGKDEAPALSISQWVKGDPVKLADGKGKEIYVVEFWATWCPPCRESIPHLTALQKKYKDAHVTFIGISEEEASVVKPFVQKMGDKMDYHVAIDKDRQTFKAFDDIAEMPGIPTAYVIDKNGKVVWSGHPMDRLEDVLDKLTRKSVEKPAEAAK